jgi:hypothetical protein
MDSRAELNRTVLAEEKGPGLEAQIAAYVAQQPERVQKWHRRLNWLQVASVALIVAALIGALVASFSWRSVGGAGVAAAWFLYIASLTPALFILGLHTVILRGFPPVPVGGDGSELKTGSRVVAQGWGFMIVAVVGGLFWGTAAYMIWAGTLTGEDILKAMDILGPVIGVGVAIVIAVSLYQKTFRSR